VFDDAEEEIALEEEKLLRFGAVGEVPYKSLDLDENPDNLEDDDAEDSGMLGPERDDM
jgi:hypothetical protein